ncbi:hypothetical protein KUTeg_008533 [Tegillarca granosa]|uniref:EF-hand domain-containing protein n=1 Tax=Tegillarca granosa TaxID=220873 RepID=A0ABQ9F9D8_TEGGR|nr:hypothetical protein KUTeg_008533 [Tegillarca granosa]
MAYYGQQPQMYHQGPPPVQQQHMYNNMAPSQAYVSWSRELCSIMIAMLDNRHAALCKILGHIADCVKTKTVFFDDFFFFKSLKLTLTNNKRSQDGFMQWQEFMELQQCLVAWHQLFCQYDHDRSGFIEPKELLNITRNSFRYNLSPECVTTILKRYSRVVPKFPGAQPECLIAFDDFVSVCVRLRAYTDAFRKRDGLQHGGETGNTTFSYDDFLRCVMCL